MHYILTYNYNFISVIYILNNLRGVHDLHRTNFIMDQMSLMISPKKLECLDVKKYLPTI